MISLISAASDYVIPVVVLLIITVGAFRRVRLFDAFAEGAKEGLSTAAELMPVMVGLITAVGVFEASGAMGYITDILRQAAEAVGIPVEVLPLFILKPISGSASAGMAADIIASQGVDSVIGRLAAVLLGATDTAIYVAAVFFGSSGIKKLRYSGWSIAVLSAAALAAAVFITA